MHPAGLGGESAQCFPGEICSRSWCVSMSRMDSTIEHRNVYPLDGSCSFAGIAVYSPSILGNEYLR